MYFLGLGLLLLGMKVLTWGLVASWSWWLVLAPFGMAMLWWAWADATGYTRRRVIRRERARQQARPGTAWFWCNGSVVVQHGTFAGGGRVEGKLGLYTACVAWRGCCPSRPTVGNDLVADIELQQQLV